MSTIAFIFARGGSKGLPGKNILPLNGKPLLAYSIEMAKRIEEVSDVYVSTEDESIAKVAEQFNAKIIHRPEELAQDDSAEFLSWIHAVQYLKTKDIIFDKFLSLPATTPLRNKTDVQSCLDLMDDKTDVVVTIQEAHRNPLFNMVQMEEDNYIKLVSVDGTNYSNRQDIPISYEWMNVVYVTKPEFVLSANSIFEGRLKAVCLPKERTVDIDDETDFIIAEALIKK